MTPHLTPSRCRALSLCAPTCAGDLDEDPITYMTRSLSDEGRATAIFVRGNRFRAAAVVIDEMRPLAAISLALALATLWQWQGSWSARRDRRGRRMATTG